jgi:hypothetical protein
MEKAEQNKQSSSVEKFLGPDTLNLLGVSDGSKVQIVSEWMRGGAETYVTDFVVEREQGVKEHLIAKACIKFGPREAMEEWLERRRIMHENGVLFPYLSAVDGAMIIEEYIPFTFKEAYFKATTDQRDQLRERYLLTYKQICGAGFKPASLHDVRSHGDDVVVIDVGEDIGGHTPIKACALSVILKAEASLRSMFT